MPHNKIAFDWLESKVDLFKPTSSMLYVGWRSRSSMWWLDSFAPSIDCSCVGLVEAHKGNFLQFNREIRSKYLGRIEEVVKEFEVGEWDLLFWDHGPEHAESETSLITATIEFKSIFNKILYACPWGHCSNDASGNPHEKHGVTIYEETFKKMGLNVITFNKPDSNAKGELIAWWEREK